LKVAIQKFFQRKKLCIQARFVELDRWHDLGTVIHHFRESARCFRSAFRQIYWFSVHLRRLISQYSTIFAFWRHHREKGLEAQKEWNSWQSKIVGAQSINRKWISGIFIGSNTFWAFKYNRRFRLWVEYFKNPCQLFTMICLRFTNFCKVCLYWILLFWVFIRFGAQASVSPHY
jgi:hypothetical protein